MRISHIRVSKEKIIKNLTKIRRAGGQSDIIGVVKANAYGHGIKQIASILRLQSMEFIAVAYPVEANVLREAGDLGKIIVIVPPSEDDGKYLVDLDLEFVIDDISRLSAFNELASKKKRVLDAHVFLNTGMNRDGIPPSKAVEFFREASNFSNIRLKGICTQLADSEMANSNLAMTQINRFNKAIRELKIAGFNPPMKHLCNTGGVINYPTATFTHSRVGIGLYGYADTKEIADKIGLEPAISVHSELLTIRKIKSGETIGYSRQYTAKKDLTIGVVPIGFGDGYSKLFTNKGLVLHSGKTIPIIGSVCMDQFMVDLTDSPGASVGDEIKLMGYQNGSTLTAYDLADTIGTIPYEILTSLNNRLERKYY